MSGFQGDPVYVIAVVSLFILAIIPAKIANKKGYSFLAYYIFGIFFFLFALFISLILKNKNQEHVRGVQVENIEKYEQMYERGEISYNDFVAKKKLLGK